MVQKRFITAARALVDTSVSVVTSDGKTYSGTLVAINVDTLSLCLANAKGEEGQDLHRILLNGKVVAQIVSKEKPFDLKALAERLNKVFPTMVKSFEDKGFIWVMEKVKVTEKGIVEGSGPVAERVQKVYEQFISEMHS